MKMFNWLKGAAVTLAALGTMLPAPQLDAAENKAPLKIERTNAAVLDVTMSAEGVFAGRVVDHTGTPSAGAAVVITQAGKEVAKTTCNERGAFAVSGLRSGVYEVASGKTSGSFRVWTEAAAPEVSKEQALLILGENGTRGGSGTFGGGTMLLGAAVVATVIVSAIALGKINDLQDDVNKIPKSP